MDDFWFSQNMRYLREKNGFPQWRLAELVGVQDSTICNWEHGYTLPTLGYLVILEELFHTDLNTLVHRNLEEEDGKDAV